MVGNLEDAQIKAILKPIGDDEGWLDSFHSRAPGVLVSRPLMLQKGIIYNNEVLMTVYWDPSVIEGYQIHMRSFSIEDCYDLIRLCFQSKDGKRIFGHSGDIYALPDKVISQLMAIIHCKNR